MGFRVPYREMAIITQTVVLKRLVGRVLKAAGEGHAPMRPMRDRVASSQSWKPPSCNSRYFFW